MAQAHPGLPKELDRYLIPSEQIVFDLRRHKVVLAEPILTTIAAFVLAFWLDGTLDGDLQVLRNAAFLIALGVLGRFVWKFLDWQREIFLATDRRLMLVYGILTRKVAIMPMAKVTDMRYDRTVPGYIFGYGKYILESAGQDQALSVINFVPDPDRHYKEISAVIFAPNHRPPPPKMVPTTDGPILPVNEPEYPYFPRK